MLQPGGAATSERARALEAQAAAGGVRQAAWQCQRGDGGAFDAELTILPLAHERRQLLIAVVRDLTETHALEARLVQAEKLDALGQLAGGVAHDFNNMLAAIMMAADQLVRSSAVERQRQLGGTILTAAERAGQLTRKLLDFARKGKVLSTPTDLHRIISETVALLGRTLDRRIVIEVRAGAAHAVVVGDPAQIQNALINLCLNARDAMPGGGTITLATERVAVGEHERTQGAFTIEPGAYLRLTVSDTGSGIAAADLQRIFDPFFTTKEVGKGTGLGLSAVFGTMESHRGAVTVASAPGRGTTFTLLFPAADEPAPAADRAGQAPQGGGLVLVVDDEELVRTALSLQLEGLGYAVVACGDPATAETLFRQHHRALVAVILDLVLPQASGTEVAERLRRIDPLVPIVLSSGFPRNAQVGRLLGNGVAGFLQKPYASHELGTLLAAVRRAPPPA